MSFTGSLQPKKKSELQEIAIALDISDSGTREELQNRIKHHLAQHEHSLADDPRFGGLYVRATRKRSVQPTMMATVKEDATSMLSASDQDQEERIRTAPRRGGRHAHTPPAMDRNDSLVKVLAEIEPANLPLPSSPVPSAVRQAASAIGRDATVLVQRVKEGVLKQERNFTLEGRRVVQRTKAFLSNASNIYSLTLLFELTIMLWAVVPTTSHTFGGTPSDPIPPPPPGPAADSYTPPSPGLTLHYPSPAFFLTPTLWTLLGKWIIPTCVIPMFFGALISFTSFPLPLSSFPSTPNPSGSTTNPYRPSPSRDLDPVTMGIMRVAFTAASKWGIREEVLPWEWRMISACVSGAFAFAEAIGERRKGAGVAAGVAEE